MSARSLARATFPTERWFCLAYVLAQCMAQGRITGRNAALEAPPNPEQASGLTG